MMADPPTPLGVAVDLTDTGVHPDADCSDEGRLTEVGAEAGPESVVGTALIESSGVNRRPMSHKGEEDDQPRQPRHDQHEEEAEPHPLRLAVSRLGDHARTR